MEQRPSPVFAERKRTLQLSPRSSPHAQHQAYKLPHCIILALPNISVKQLSLQMYSRNALKAIKLLQCDLPYQGT